MERGSLATALCVFLLTFLHAGPAMAQKKVALIVGNSAYASSIGILDNPKRDADAMAVKLEQVGFDVLLKFNETKQDLEQSLIEFEDRLRGADVGLFFFAGHGFQVEGQNYLVTTNAEIGDEIDVDEMAIRLERVQSLVEQNATTSVVLIDACRDNPFSGTNVKLPADGAGGTRLVRASSGLAAVRNFVPRNQSSLNAVPVNSIVGFSASAGRVAYDAVGTINSPFVTALLRHLFEPRLDVRVLLGRVSRDVVSMTNGEQQPQIFSQLGNFFSLVESIPVIQQGPNLPRPMVNYVRSRPYDSSPDNQLPATGFQSSDCSILGANTVATLDDLSWIDQRSALFSIEALMASKTDFGSGLPAGSVIELEGASASEFHHNARILGEVTINDQRLRIVFGASYAYGRFGSGGPERAFSLFEYHKVDGNYWVVSSSGLGLVTSYSDPKSDGDPRVIWIDEKTYAVEFPNKKDIYSEQITYYYFVPMDRCFKVFETNGRREFLNEVRDWLAGG